MTEKQIAEFKSLQNLFTSECERVAQHLKHAPGSETGFADEFSLEDDTVFWEGDEYWRYGGHEHYSGSFPAEYLTMTDEQLTEIVNKKIEEHDAMEKAKKEASTAKALEERRKKYEELKKEFGE